MEMKLENSSKRSNPPVPKGNSFYALAKQAEYVDKDTPLAKFFYQQSILHGNKMESALKDLASLLHKDGDTQQACDLLLSHLDHVKGKGKLNNLLRDLSYKLIPTKNTCKKVLKLLGVTESDSIASVKRLFSDSSRILSVKLLQIGSTNHALIYFSSHSAARKTLTTLQNQFGHTVEWVDATEEAAGVPTKYSEDKQWGDEEELAIKLIGKGLFIEVCC